MAGTLREEEGDDAIATRTLPLIREAAADGERDTVLVDGLRSTVELERFREAFGDDFTLVAVRAPFEIRAERLDDRGRDESDSDLEALRERATPARSNSASAKRSNGPMSRSTTPGRWRSGDASGRCSASRKARGTPTR